MPYIGTSPSNGVRRVHTYTATASQTTFTGASSEGVTLSYADTNYIDVFQNGVLLGSADYTSTSGTSVVLAQGASADDLVVIVVYDVFSVADTVSKTNGGSFDSAVTMSNNLTVSGAFTSQGIDDNADATAITIDSSEKVGIGTTSPSDLLEIQGGSADGIRISVSGQSYYHKIRTNGDGLLLSADDSDAGGSGADMRFNVANSEAMRILNTGDLAINSTSNTTPIFSAAHLKVTADASRNNMVVENHRQNMTAYGVHADGSSGTRYALYIVNGANSEVGKISYTSSATTYSTTSDYRLKENISYDFDATTRLKQLKPCRFNFIIDEDNNVVDGFLAHEVSSIVPEAILGEKDATKEDGSIDPQSIDQAKLVPLLVKTIQELEARITALENAE